MVLKKDGEGQLDYHVRNEEVLNRVKQERNILHTVKTRKGSSDWKMNT